MTNNEVERVVPPIEDMRLLDVALDYREKAEAEIARLKGELTDAAFAITDAYRRTYRSKAERDALQLQLDIERAGAVEMARVIAALRAQLGEVRAAVKAERQRENDLSDGGGNDEWTRLQEAKALTDAVVARVEPDAAKDEPITAEALRDEGWVGALAEGCGVYKGDDDYHVWVGLRHGQLVVGVYQYGENVRMRQLPTMPQLRQLVRLMGAA